MKHRFRKILLWLKYDADLWTIGVVFLVICMLALFGWAKGYSERRHRAYQNQGFLVGTITERVNWHPIR